MTDILQKIPETGDVDQAMTDEKKIISIDDVTIHYGAFKAVQNVSLDIAQNKVTAFIGPSGCGKSTVLRSINRMNGPDSIGQYHREDTL